MNTIHTINVENLKCNGCSGTIRNRLNELDGVANVQIDVEAEQVTFTSPTETIEGVRETLERLGYPEQGSMSGLASVGAKARSFVSCAIGVVGSG